MTDDANPTSADGPEAPVVYDFDPRNLPTAVLEAVGLAVAAAAQTESVVQELIGALLKIDMIETRALTAQMSATLKDQIVRALTELNAPTSNEVDFLDELMDAVNDAFQKRNTIVHNALLQHPKTHEILSLREQARGSLRMKLQPITAAQIEKDALSIYEAGMDLMRFMISRGIAPKDRTLPLRELIERGPKARTKRQQLRGN